jgi:hypothetical protein
MKTSKNQNLLEYCIVALIMLLSSLTFASDNWVCSEPAELYYWQSDSTLENEDRRYRQKQEELPKELESMERTKEILRNSVISYARYNPKDTAGIVDRWLMEFRAVTRFSDHRMAIIERDIRRRAKTRLEIERPLLHTLDLYCLDILVINMTAEEYGRYIKDVHLLHRWLATRASNKMYIHYKSVLKLSDEETTEAFKKLMVK